MSSANQNEVEIKFRVADLKELEKKLRELGFQEKTPATLEVNTLYDDRERTLRARGEVLRVRRYGTKWVLTHKSKGSVARHKSRVELETEVADGETLDRVLRALGFAPSFVYEKYRAEWSDGEGHVVLDATPIGDFAEIEGAEEWIDRVATKLGVRDEDFITGSYVALFNTWKREHKSDARDMTFAAIGGGKPS